jgi:ferredoxin-NADP reductase
LETIVKIARYPKDTRFAFICISNEFMFKARAALEKAGLGNINIQFTNSTDERKITKTIDDVDVIIVSPGRSKDVQSHNVNNKYVMKFLYSLDDNSVKELKSKIIDLKYQK